MALGEGPPTAKGRARRWIPVLGVAVVVATLAAPALFLILINVGDSRSFLVEARTSQITLTFGGGPSQWRLPNATLCAPTAEPDLASTDPCGVAFASEGSARERIIDWTEDETVTLTIEPDGALRIAAANKTRVMPAGGYLIVDPDIWGSVGALVFQAETTLGADMATGARHYLWSGRWEAREAGLATSLFRSETEVVKSGDLSTGANVDILAGEEPALSYGHITRQDDEGPMNVTLLSEFADAALSIRHYGVEQAVRIRPDWVDVAINSPLLIALAAVFPVLGSVGLFIAEVVWQMRAPGRRGLGRATRRWRRRLMEGGTRRRN